MGRNPLVQLGEAGQSVWYDNVRRGLLRDGTLGDMIEAGEVSGVTSNPTIFEKAIGGSKDYDEAIQALVRQGKDAEAIFEALAIEDIQTVADLLRPVYDRTRALDGYVSLEEPPRLGNDVAGSIEEARRLFRLLDRPNVMIKIPGTDAGIEAFERAIGEGINVNVTLLFSLESYERVARAYIAGLQRLADSGGDLSRVASVASFFVSRVDSAVDALLEAQAKSGDEGAKALLGKAAVANARLAYERFKQIFAEPAFQALAARGAQAQRPLWASTGTKNPSYSDVLYVEELVGPDTVNTMPPATIDAFRDHGRVVPNTIEQDLEGARASIAALAQHGVDLDAVTRQLQLDGLKSFANSFDTLIAATADKARALTNGAVAQLSSNVGLEAAPKGLAERIWVRDGSAWSDDPAAQRHIPTALGWLNLPDQMLEQADFLTELAEEVRRDGFQDVFLLGMGGSSLAPEVLRQTFGSRPGYPRLTVLDTTHPDAIRAFEQGIDPATTLFLVASKSGGTIESLSFFRYFFSRVQASKGERAGENFIALTDPGTSLEALAHEHGFRAVISTPADVGGRYSALTQFGLLPAALLGLNLRDLLERARAVMQACQAEHHNPGLSLGLLLGQQALAGRDKVTLVLPPAIASFGLWVEQLLAESTGKGGKGLIPIAEEPLGAPESYGDDRLFVALQVADGAGGSTDQLDERLSALERSGHPVARLALADLQALSGEFYRWEMATAAAGTVLLVNPFDQPNVQESKDNTAAVLAEFQQSSALPVVESADADAVAAFVRQAGAGDYLAIVAYVAPTAETDRAFSALRTSVRDGLKVATTLGYGPRFLHSTGQLHKGGPNSGLFVQLVAPPQQDLEIPGAPYSFGTLIEAQALGDLRSLQAHGRRVIRHSLGADPLAGLAELSRAIERATTVG